MILSVIAKGDFHLILRDISLNYYSENATIKIIKTTEERWGRYDGKE